MTRDEIRTAFAHYADEVVRAHECHRAAMLAPDPKRASRWAEDERRVRSWAWNSLDAIIDEIMTETPRVVW